MPAVDLATLIDYLPPGRARALYERLLQAVDGAALAVPVPYCPHPLWLVEHQAQAGKLVTQGIPRWRIWTLAELRDWLGPVESLADAAAALTAGEPETPSA
jgi:hypothetical protein